MRTLALACCCLLTALLFGCTTQLNVEPIQDTPLEGQVYYLPRTEVGISLEREITRCSVNPSGFGLASEWFQMQVENLATLQGLFDHFVDQKVSLTCPDDANAIDPKIGTLAQRLRAGFHGAVECSKAKDHLQQQYDQVLQRLIDEWFQDPWFVASGAESLMEEALAKLSPPGAATPTLDATKPPRDRIAKLEGVANELASDAVRFDVDLGIDLRTAITPYFLPDVNRAYAIDYTGTKRSLKKTEYNVETYPNGTLKSINVALDDKSAEVIQSTLRGALSLAGGLSGVPVSFAAAQAEGLGPPALPSLRSFSEFRKDYKVPALCTEPIRNLIRERQALDKALGKLPSEIRGLQAAFDKAKGEVTKATADLAKAKKDGKTGDELKPFETAVKTKTAAQAAAKAKLDAKKKEAEPIEARRRKVRAELTISAQAHLLPESSPGQIEITGYQEAVAEWFVPKSLAEYCQAGALECREVTLGAGPSKVSLPRQILAWSALYLSPEAPTESTKTIDQEETTGIVYRQPATGLLLICSGVECLDDEGKIQVTSKGLVEAQTLTVPQLGKLATLPLVNKSFQNNSIQATFAPTGVLTRVEYNSNARAEAAAAAFEGSAADIVAFLDARREADKAELEAEVAKVEEEKNLVAAQLELEQERKKLEAFRAGLPIDDSSTDDDPADDTTSGDEEEAGDDSGDDS